MKFKFILLSLIFLVNTACTEPDGGDFTTTTEEAEQITPPIIDMACSSSTATRCAAGVNGNKVLALLLDSSSNIAAAQILDLTCDGSGCGATFTSNSWESTTSANVTEISAGTYTISIYLDINGNASTLADIGGNFNESGTDATCFMGSGAVSLTTSSQAFGSSSLTCINF